MVDGGYSPFFLLFVRFPICQTFCQQHRAGSQESPRNRMKPISGKEFHGNEKEKTLMSCWSGCSVHFPVKNIALTFSLDCAVFVSADVLLNVYVVSDIQNEQFKSQVIEKYFLSITPYSQSPPPSPHNKLPFSYGRPVKHYQAEDHIMSEFLELVDSASLGNLFYNRCKI